MKGWIPILLVTAIFCFAASTAQARNAPQLIRLRGLSQDQIREIADSGLEITVTGKGVVEVVATPDEQKLLIRPDRSPEIVIPDLDAYVAGRLAGQRRGAEYFTYERLVEALEMWEANHSAIARLHVIGRTWEGRDILAMKVSDNPDRDEAEPAVLINGAHHAREWISTEVAMESLRQLLEGYGRDANLTRLVNERETWFVPVLNPDGVVFSQTQERYWRKNRRPITATAWGVDLNRNYDYTWGTSGTTADPAKDTFAGPAAFSEPETQAIKALAERERFQACLALHSYSELVLYPYSYAKNAPNPDKSRFQVLAQDMAAFNGYQSQNSAELYAASGVLDDWLYGTFRTLALTIEIGRAFIPPADQIAELCRLNVPAVFFLIDKAGTHGVTTPGSLFVPESLADSRTAFDAVVDGVAVLSILPPEARMFAADTLRSVGVRLSELVAFDVRHGDTAVWNLIRSTPEADFVIPLVRERLRFDSLHHGATDGEGCDPARN